LNIFQAFDLAKETTTYIQALNRRSMDHLAAKVWFYLARCAELLKRDEEVRSYVYAILSRYPAG